MELAVNIDEEMKTGFPQVPGKSARVNAVAFDHAELRAAPTFGQGMYLVVSGPAPENGAHVRLLPSLGGDQPDYRQIEIVSEERAANDDLPQGQLPARYEKSMPLSGLSGPKGIELIGLNGRKKFSLADGAFS